MGGRRRGGEVGTAPAGRRRLRSVVALTVAFAIGVASGAVGATIATRDEPDEPATAREDTATTSATPTVAASPTAAPRVRPGAATTGVPAGTVLTPSESVIVTEPGTVLEDLDIAGCVDVKASNVIIRRSKIRCGRPTTAIRQWTGSSGLLVEDVEIDGQGKVETAVGFGGYTLRRLNVHNVIDGPRLASNTVIEASWIHDLARTAGSHNDAIQTTGGKNIVIRGNSLEVFDAESGDLFNAAIMIGSTTAPEVRNMTVEDNYLDGGNYTVNFRKDLVAAEIVYRGNRFGRNSRYGPVAGADREGVTFDQTNVWDDTGKPIFATSGAGAASQSP